MRKVGIKLAGLAAAVVGVSVADNADATDRTITTVINTPVTTAQPEPPTNVTPGNVSVTGSGGITITTGQSAITLNAPNTDVTNSGDPGITSNDADNSVGIRIVGGFDGDVQNNGIIALTETYTASDLDNDGDLDGEWAQGTGRVGILLDGGMHTGNITHLGRIGVESDNSGGIILNSRLTGTLTSSGAVTIIGDNSYAFAINGGLAGGVVGNVVLGGGNEINVRGVNSVGLLVDAPITGELSLNGTWNVTGFHTATRPITQENMDAIDADDLLLGGSAVEVHYSIGNGITIEGIGVENDDDDDADGSTADTGDTNDDLSANITTSGTAPALLISPNAVAPLVLGATSSGHGLNIRGTVAAQGVYDGFSANAIRIEGANGQSTTTAAGILNDGVVFASAFDGDATSLSIGDDTSVPELRNRRQITANVTSDNASDNAVAVLVELGASMPTIINTGAVLAQAFGENSNAYGFIDRSNTVQTITNRGSIRAQAAPTDDDLNDGVEATADGETVAIDLSTSTVNVLLEQLADVVFTDQDGDDDDVNARPAVSIAGDVRFGAGNDTFHLYAGSMLGDVNFSTGDDTFIIDNGALFAGRVTDVGTLDIEVINGSLGVAGGLAHIDTAIFRADAELSVLLSTVPADTTFIHAEGVVTFENGSRITPFIPGGLPVSGATTFLTADGGIIGANFVTGVVDGVDTPYIYNLAIAEVVGDPNSLEARYLLKSTTELGLNPNETSAFDPIVEALRQDTNASSAFARLTTQESFETAYDDLLPSFSQGATELAATAVQQSQSAATNRLASTRLRDVDDTSVWVQEIGYGLTREPLTNGVEYRGFGFGVAGGIDAPLDNGALFGVAASFVTSQVEEPGRPDGEIAASFGQANAYLGTALGPIDLDFVGGLGLGRMSSRRVIEIGTGFQRTTEADWWAYEGHAAARASLPLAMADWFIITPQVALTYMALNEQGYEEDGAGAAFNVEADSALTQRLWADAGLEISGRWRLRGEGQIAPRLFVGYRTNVLSDDNERTFRFTGGNDFTLTDPSSDEGAPLIGIGVDATNGFSTFSLGYEGELGDEIERHSLNAAIRFRF